MKPNSIDQNGSLILAIDTSCDETSVAVLEGRRVLANVVSSQVELHKKWGGVVPAVARRAHIENLPNAVDESLKRSKLTINDLDAIGVTQGPGLAIDLEIGVAEAKKLAIENSKPFVPVNHMEGHMFSSLILNSKGKGPLPVLNEDELFPALGLLVSGKHTEIIYIRGFNEYEKIGKTLDDAAGEAFDKFGRIMGFGYPGGPIVSEFARKGKPNELIKLPIPMERSDDYNFSYSGLKTACLYRTNALREQGLKESEWANDFCYAFVDSITKSIIIKLRRAIVNYPEIKGVLGGGGVYKSEQISRAIGVEVRSHGKKYLLPEVKYRGDNAAMIGLVAGFTYSRGEFLTDIDEIDAIDRIPRLSL